jgi:hypothetical protein
MTPYKTFLLGATIESSEQHRLVYASDDWIQVEAQGLTTGIRVEFRVEGQDVVLRVVGYKVGQPSADQEIFQDTLPLCTS